MTSSIFYGVSCSVAPFEKLGNNVKRFEWLDNGLTLHNCYPQYYGILIHP